MTVETHPVRETGQVRRTILRPKERAKEGLKKSVVLTIPLSVRVPTVVSPSSDTASERMSGLMLDPTMTHASVRAFQVSVRPMVPAGSSTQSISSKTKRITLHEHDNRVDGAERRVPHF